MMVEFFVIIFFFAILFLLLSETEPWYDKTYKNHEHLGCTTA